MNVDAYEAKFYVQSRYATQLVTTEEERIQLFVIGLNLELQVLSVHMTSIGKSFKEVTDFVKKVGGRRDGKAKVLAKNPKNVGNCNDSYSRGLGRPTIVARPIQLAFASTGGYSGTLQQNSTQNGQGAFFTPGSKPSLDRSCYNCGESGHIRRDYPHPRMTDRVQQQTREVVPVDEGNNGRGHPQGV